MMAACNPFGRVCQWETYKIQRDVQRDVYWDEQPALQREVRRDVGLERNVHVDVQRNIQQTPNESFTKQKETLYET